MFYTQTKSGLASHKINSLLKLNIVYFGLWTKLKTDTLLCFFIDVALFIQTRKTSRVRPLPALSSPTLVEEGCKNPHRCFMEQTEEQFYHFSIIITCSGLKLNLLWSPKNKGSQVQWQQEMTGGCKHSVSCRFFFLFSYRKTTQNRFMIFYLALCFLDTIF